MFKVSDWWCDLALGRGSGIELSNGLGTTDPMLDDVADEQLDSGEGESGRASGLSEGVSTYTRAALSTGRIDREG